MTQIGYIINLKLYIDSTIETYETLKVIYYKSKIKSEKLCKSYYYIDIH